MKFAAPTVVGIPLITPAGESDRPAGKDPPASDHVYGVVPPVADSVCEYCTLTVPSGSDAVVMEGGGGLTVMDSALVAVCEALSATCAVKFDVTAVLGVPLITPCADNWSPAGKVPADRDHV